MNFGSDNGMSKRRKVFYDDYTGGFYTESRMENLKRKCDYSGKMAEVINRSEVSRLNVALKTVNTAKHLFEMKTERETTFYRDCLKDHLAYKHVLEGISKERDSDSSWDWKYGRYGKGVNRTDLEPQINEQLVEMAPDVKRKRQAEMLLSQRKKPEVFDRNMKTNDLLGLIKNKRTKSSSPVRRKTGAPYTGSGRRTPKLILPPITVTMSRESTADKVVNVRNLESTHKRSNTTTADTSGLPTVFVTQFEPT
ncbi:hypothetical protein KP79_PYT12074 [Mizuhopecten yessoensis]|uniref:Uncharacterized protein n=1 Tax=Mizuhopecten yessoensis TaxID=6573 RepID=A0A210Q786_MIZYE|nr:hypothetical protein KP79_PYT12074 [Mizuhopecten yessoensis]